MTSCPLADTNVQGRPDDNRNPAGVFDVGKLRSMIASMQWYLASLAMLLVMAATGVLTGALVIACLPARMQPCARIFLSLPLGWSLLTLIAVLPGWIGPSYAHCPCTAMTAGLSAAGAWVGRHWLRRAGGDAVRLAAFCIIASYPILGSLAYHGIFGTGNDTFIYICHAQWLQHHAFARAPQIAGGYPAWAQVLSFQQSHLRMGASFLLGWVQAMFGLEWSCDAYPALSALGVICAASGVAATLLAACPGRWVEAWLTALAVAGTVNGFTFGAANGFLPQTWGIAFAAAAFGLRGLELGTHAERAGRAPWATGLPLGIGVAASMHCYWDLLPLEAPALAATYLWPWPGRDARFWRRVWRQARVPALTAFGLVNLEWIRAVRGILQNLTAVVANPVAWSVASFPAHALGLRSSIWEGGRWVTAELSVVRLLAGGAAVVVWLAVMAAAQEPARWRHWLRPPRRWSRWRGRPLLPALVWVGMSTGLFVYFRYVVASPWHGQTIGRFADGIGQSWSQYKVTIWASFAVISLVAGSLVGLALRSRTGARRWSVVTLLAIWCGTGLGWDSLIAARRGTGLCGTSGIWHEPLTACLAMRQTVKNLPPNEWIYLDWPPGNGSEKYRQMLVYYLNDHPLASDWSHDGYLSPYVPSEDAQRTAADCDWIIRYRPPGRADSPTLGGMTLDRVIH